MLTLEACDMRKDGRDIKDVIIKTEALKKKLSVSFFIDSLTFLHKGGRCSAVKKLSADIFSIKPVISVGTDGNMTPGRKYIGSFQSCTDKYLNTAAENAEKHSEKKKYALLLYTEGTDESIVSYGLERIKAKEIFQTVYCYKAGCTITAHCGKNTLGLLYFTE